MTSGTRKFHYGWVVILTCLLTTVGAHGFGRMAYTIILPAMKDGLDLNYTQSGLLGTGNFIGYLVMALVGGMIAARLGSRLVIAMALALMGITMILTGFADRFETAFALRLGTGLGNGAAFVPAMALSAAWFGVRKRGLAAGIVSAGIGGGTLIAGLVVPPILASHGDLGWRYTWGYLGAAVLVIALVAGMLLRNNPKAMGLERVGGDGAEKNARQPADQVGPFSWGAIFRTRAIWYLGLIYFMYGFSYIIYMTFFAAFLVKDVGMTPQEAGGLWALVGGLSIFCGVIWGAVSDRLGRGKGAAMAYLFLAAAYFLFAGSGSQVRIFLSAIVFGLTAWSIPTIMAAAAGDLVGPRLAPAGLGLATIFFGLGQALGPGVGGYIADLQNSFASAFFLAGIVSLIGALLSFFFNPRDKIVPRD